MTLQYCHQKYSDYVYYSVSHILTFKWPSALLLIVINIWQFQVENSVRHSFPYFIYLILWISGATFISFYYLEFSKFSLCPQQALENRCTIFKMVWKHSRYFVFSNFISKILKILINKTNLRKKNTHKHQKYIKYPAVINACIKNCYHDPQSEIPAKSQVTETILKEYALKTQFSCLYKLTKNHSLVRIRRDMEVVSLTPLV